MEQKALGCIYTFDPLFEVKKSYNSIIVMGFVELPVYQP